MNKIPAAAFAQRAAISRLLRFMMFENPLEAEQYAVDFDNPELKNIDLNDTGAVEFQNPNGTIEYIVYSHGTKYTTTLRPTHIPDNKIRHFKGRAAGQRLWDRLQAECQGLKSTSQEAYEDSGLAKVLASVAYFYSQPSTPLERPLARYRSALASLGKPSELMGDDAIRSWAGKCRSQLPNLYASYILAGDEVRLVLTTLTLFELCPFSLTDLFAMNAEFLQHHLKNKNIVMDFPIVDLKFYLEHPAIRPDFMVVWGTSAARVLQKQAEELRDEAKLKYTVEEFHFSLYVALLYYRCALYAYRVVLSSSKAGLAVGPRAAQRIKEARTEVALCEEHRVIIMSSLTAVVGLGDPSRPSIADVVEVQNWVARLVALSSGNAEFAIREAYSAELMMPRFLRDVSLGLAYCFSGKTQQGLAKMLAAMQDLEKHLEKAMILGDPNYLSTTYELMFRICSKNGMREQSAEYHRRAQPSYYRKLVNF
jgi:hypothetical protein